MGTGQSTESDTSSSAGTESPGGVFQEPQQLDEVGLLSLLLSCKDLSVSGVVRLLLTRVMEHIKSTAKSTLASIKQTAYKHVCKYPPRQISWRHRILGSFVHIVTFGLYGCYLSCLRMYKYAWHPTECLMTFCCFCLTCGCAEPLGLGWDFGGEAKAKVSDAPLGHWQQPGSGDSTELHAAGGFGAMAGHLTHAQQSPQPFMYYPMPNGAAMAMPVMYPQTPYLMQMMYPPGVDGSAMREGQSMYQTQYPMQMMFPQTPQPMAPGSMVPQMPGAMVPQMHGAMASRTPFGYAPTSASASVGGWHGFGSKKKTD